MAKHDCRKNPLSTDASAGAEKRTVIGRRGQSGLVQRTSADAGNGAETDPSGGPGGRDTSNPFSDGEPSFRIWRVDPVNHQTG